MASVVAVESEAMRLPTRGWGSVLGRKKERMVWDGDCARAVEVRRDRAIALRDTVGGAIV